jgi:hypothetical protein
MHIVAIIAGGVFLAIVAVGFAIIQDTRRSEACAHIGMTYSARPYSPACVKSDGSLWEVPSG